MKNLLQIIFCLLNLTFSTKLIQEGQLGNNSNFIFGSCNRSSEKKPSQIFKQVKNESSKIFVWLGDAAYVDKRIFPFIWVPNEYNEVVKAYETTYLDKYYIQVRNKKKILGIYDDHDLNQNDGDKYNPTKEWAKDIFLDFINEPKESQRRLQPDGIYESYYIGDSRIKLILLDVRYNRDRQTEDTLGEGQWEWLEKELQDPSPFLFVIGSGVQVLPDDRISENFMQKSKLRLFKLIKKYKARVILLSGDIHMAEILKQPCSKNYFGYDMVEITSSGLNQSYDEEIIQVLTNIFNSILPPTYSDYSQRKILTYNYGTFNVEWSQVIEESIISINIYGLDSNYPILQKQFYLQDLDPSNSNEDEDFVCEELGNKWVRIFQQIGVVIFESSWQVQFILGLLFLNLLLFIFCTCLCFQSCLLSRKNKKIQKISQSQKSDKEKSQDKKEQ